MVSELTDTSESPVDVRLDFCPVSVCLTLMIFLCILLSQLFKSYLANFNQGYFRFSPLSIFGKMPLNSPLLFFHMFLVIVTLEQF